MAKVKKVNFKPSSSDDERRIIEAPQKFCMYDKFSFMEVIHFFDLLDREVLVNYNCVYLDFSKTTYISAAAALMLFARVTRCQCNGPIVFHARAEQVVTACLPDDAATKQKMINSGLWAAIKPGGQKKLDRLWGDLNNPYKTGNNPAEEIDDVIDLLQKRFSVLPRQIVAALQEAFLNIAHHAYVRNDKVLKVPTADFMIGRWWLYAQQYSNGNISCIVCDLGTGIPNSILPKTLFPGDDCEQIHYAMQSGVTRFNIQGRGMGFDNIKKPIEVNESAEYLVVYSGKGRVLYRKGQESSRVANTLGVQGTLVEWVFGDAKK